MCPLSRLFRQYLDVPVLLENDANCAAVGEWLCGAGRGTQQFIVVTLGTGVGGGLILNGKLYSGSGMVGEVGHMVIQHGGAAVQLRPPRLLGGVRLRHGPDPHDP